MVFKADDVAIRTFGRRFEELIVDLSASELTAAASTYRDADEESAREIDSAYGTPPARTGPL